MTIHTPSSWHILKGFCILLGLLLFGGSNSLAQQIPATASNTSPNQPIYTEVSRGPHSRVLQTVATLTNAAGRTITRTNRYTELATGLSRSAGDQFVASSDQIHITTNGAAATNAPHQVFFPSGLSAGTIDCLDPAGQHLRSQIFGLAYFDSSTGTNILIGQLQDSTGELLPSGNQVLYTNAFTDIQASVRYTFKINGLIQDIILEQQPPPPSVFNLNPATTRLQILTEFPEVSAPRISHTTIDNKTGLSNEDLDFGVMKMSRGYAFSIGEEKVLIPVAKHWVVMSGRNFLVEELPLTSIASELQKLSPPSSGSGGSNLQPSSPPAANGDQSSARKTHPTLAVGIPMQQALMRFPAHKVATKNAGPMPVAMVTPPQRGLLWDYDLINGSLTNFVFQSDTTYFITNTVNLYGTTIFEGGTVVKLPASSVNIQIQEGLNCLTGPYRPAIFTAKDDNTIGDTIAGSTGAPSGYYGLYMINILGGDNYNLRYLRVNHAQYGIWLDGPGPTNQFNNLQIGNCQYGISDFTGTANVQNCLFYNTETALYTGLGIVVNVQNVTADTCNYFDYDGDSLDTILTVTNSLLVSCTNLCNFSGVTTNHTGVTNNPGSVFQTAGAGGHYLPTNSPYLTAGTANIDPVLLADLRQKTTYPPLWLTNTITNDTILTPQAQRDTNANPTLGYHFDSIDYISFCPVTNATLTLTNGVTLAYYNGAGIWLQSGSHLVSQGAPTQHNCLVYYRLVQEQPIDLWGAFSPAFEIGESLAITTYNPGGVQNPSILLRFTTFSGPAGASYLMFFDGSSWFISNLTARDCEFYASGSTWNEYSTTNNLIENLQNNLFLRANVLIASSGQVNAGNNLFLGADQNMFIYYNGSGSTSNTFLNNAFDNCADVYFDGTYSNNAYLNGTTIDPGVTLQTNDIVTNLTWISGLLGNFYQATNSPLLNVGSTTADQLGLYHYTTTTNQIPEFDSIVDIGYHYVALGTNGLPLDSNSDGIPDYLQDANGNGIVDNGETDWMLMLFDPDNIGPTALKVYTPLK